MPRAGRLSLETGVSFDGLLFGHPLGEEHAWGEVVFNTCMTGYQEVASDPSYAGQLVVMTYPMIGSYGCRDAFLESGRMHCRGLIVRQISEFAGHGLSERSLDDELKRFGVPCLSDVDTRAVTRHIRTHGSIRGVIAEADQFTSDHLVELARQSARLEEQDLVSAVSQRENVAVWHETLPQELDWSIRHAPRSGRFGGLRIVCLDLGIKRNQLRALASRGVEVVTVRHDSGYEDILGQDPDGVVISNGPGDPATLTHQVLVVRTLVERGIPMLGICLGHQLLARAVGGTTSRLPFGHHGGNHPVRDAITGAVYITAQSHEFQVDGASMGGESGWYVSERNLNDGSVEGLRHETLPVMTVQYHPEGGPGPQDRANVFDEFLAMAASRKWGGPGRHTEMRVNHVDPPGPPDSILVIGSGPVVIGQAAEFDYAGTQACKALREEGVRVVLINSNPATIMTDEGTADTVYIEPLTVAVVERIIEKERPDGLLPTLGGQTGLNLAVALDDAGVLNRFGVRVLGTSLDTIRVAEDRERFKGLLQSIGEPVPPSRTVSSLFEARRMLEGLGLPLVVRPAFTLGGTGGGLCETEEIFIRVVTTGLAASPIGQVLIEQSLAGWREIEYEVMRDGSGTAITVCTMENLDPMGVHTGDSVVVAPSQTLTDREHQRLRSSALRIISALGIEGGCNVQFALEPEGAEYFVIEVNPRVSRSSALASKATGYPIARVAAKVALGRRLDEIPNAITGKTTAAFEPALDYCVVKIPRWPFDKFPDGDRRLGTQMKSTGEVMAIESTFEAAFSKALRSLELPMDESTLDDPVLLGAPNDRRFAAVMDALRSGTSVKEIALATGIGEWFVERLWRLVRLAAGLGTASLTRDHLREAKRAGLSDEAIGRAAGLPEQRIIALRRQWQIAPAYRCVDTCAAEFEALTPYYYSTFESVSEVEASPDSPVLVLGSGPIRIGQGIEFDYCSVQAAQTLREVGIAAVMINSNPETVSTDFDASTRLYFEPLDAEAVIAVAVAEKARGVMAQFGGQTAINLAAPLGRAGLSILGTGVDSIDLAEDRSRFEALLERLEIRRPRGGATLDADEARKIALTVGFPVLVRPSFVLGGRGMEIIGDEEDLTAYMRGAVAALPKDGADKRRGSVLVDEYILGREIDADVISDGQTVVIPGLMEHIERTGVHSGDSMAIYPARLDRAVEEAVVDITERIVRSLKVRGLCNLQLVIYQGRPYIIEVNPRASRTVPFLSKVTGVPMVALATRVAAGERLADLGWISGLLPPEPLVAIKAPVFSTAKLDKVDSALGPEMKSTGEVMGIDLDRPAAVEKAFLAALGRIPLSGAALCSIADTDKEEALPIMRRLAQLGFQLYATAGTARLLARSGQPVSPVGRIGQSRPSVIDVIEDGTVCIVVNTVSRAADGARANSGAFSARTVRDGYFIRDAAERRRIPCCTSLDTADALVEAIARHSKGRPIDVRPLPAYRKNRRPIAVQELAAASASNDAVGQKEIGEAEQDEHARPDSG